LQSRDPDARPETLKVDCGKGFGEEVGSVVFAWDVGEIDDLFLDRLPKEVMAKIGVLCRIVNVRGGGKGIPCDYFGKGWDQEEGS
jgi:hypothetical protein